MPAAPVSIRVEIKLAKILKITGGVTELIKIENSVTWLK